MPVLLRNCYFDTQRSTFTAGTGVTGRPTAYLTDQYGAFEQADVQDYIYLPEGAILSSFMITVDLKMDIIQYDSIVNIRKLDKVTPWVTLGANEVYRVHYIHYRPFGVLGHKEVFIYRITGGGLPS